MNVLISAPSLDPNQNVSGISSVVSFIIDNNKKNNYIHFELGKKDNEKGGLNRVKAIIKAIWTWKKMLQDYPDALIHYSFPLSVPSILRDPLFMWMAKCKNRKMAVHVHGGVFLTAERIPFILKMILKWVFSWNLPFIVLSDVEKSILTERWGTKDVVSLPNCVDLSDAEKYNRQWTDRPLRIGYLGRIEPNKGMSELLEACMLLKKQNVNFVLNIAGKEAIKDEFLPVFEQKLGGSFHYSGVVSGESKKLFLRNLDVFVLPSYFEGLPMSLLECMSYGCVPVTTPVGSIPEVVKDGENGVFIKVKDSDSLAEAIKKLDANREILLALGKNAKETIFRDFSPKAYIEKLNEVYRRL